MFPINTLYCRSDRVTVQEREKMELDQERKEVEKKKNAEERTKISRKVSWTVVVVVFFL